MIELSFGALVMAAVGASPLLAAGLLTALVAAVAVSAITVRADEKNRGSLDQGKTRCRRTASPRTTAMRRRRRDWTTAVVSWQAKTSSAWLPVEWFAEHGTLPL